MMYYENIIFFSFFILIVLVLTKPLGCYIYNVYNQQKTYLDWYGRPLEKCIYKISGININKEQTWKEYTLSLLWFSLFSLILVFIILKFQQWLPLNPQNIVNMSTDQAVNTAVSFVSNTNWQSYAGESAVSYFSQMAALAVQNFLSAAIGLAVAMTLIRCIARSKSKTIGNFWFDLVRAVIWILLPLSIVLAIIYIMQGVPQNLMEYLHIHTLSGAEQIIPQGPIASQEAIKSLGTNGGGFFNANSAHPYENPTAITNFLQVLSIFAIGAALTYTFGKSIKNQKQGWFILAIMGILFVISLSVMYISELRGSPTFSHLQISSIHGQTQQHIANFEGKEDRFGISGSVLYNTVSTSASDGGVNSTLDSYTPIGGAAALINMALGEVIVGGVGAGLYGFLMFIILAAFVGSLMVGKIPELFGKRIQGKEMKMVMMALLVSPACVLIFTGIAAVLPTAIGSVGNTGPHGFSEILYAFTSASNNNGSAFAGLNANTCFFNYATSICMLVGRFGMIIPILAICGSLALKQKSSAEKNSLSTSSVLFGVLVLFTILVIGGLTIFPALSLGPIADHTFVI